MITAHGSHVYTHNNAKFAPPVGELPTVTDAKSEVARARCDYEQRLCSSNDSDILRFFERFGVLICSLIL